jgi:hypothetical protein
VSALAQKSDHPIFRRERGQEAVKKLAKRENNSRKDAKAQSVAKQTKEFFFALLCVFAPLREIVHSFTASCPRPPRPL